STIRHAAGSALFPYTTLFRSKDGTLRKDGPILDLSDTLDVVTKPRKPLIYKTIDEVLNGYARQTKAIGRQADWVQVYGITKYDEIGRTHGGTPVKIRTRMPPK